jgi:hypothetical protein
MTHGYAVDSTSSDMRSDSDRLQGYAPFAS